MSLPINYEGLRHQIEKLVRENEELKKLVRLIRENQELKSALKTQAISLNGGLGEAGASPSQHPEGEGSEAVPAEQRDRGLRGHRHHSATAQNTGSFPASQAWLLHTAFRTGGRGQRGRGQRGRRPGQVAGRQAVLAAGTPPPDSSSELRLGGGSVAGCGGLGGAPGGLWRARWASVAGSVGLLAGSWQAVAGSVGLRGGLWRAVAGSRRAQATPPAHHARCPALAPGPAPPAPGPPPRPAPPRPASSLASVSDPRGPRTPMEPAPRKSVPELERKGAHRKACKPPDGSRESKQLAWERLVGEIAFQLDRRILSSIFPERVRLYGFTVSNIPEKIIQASLNPADHKLDEELCQTLTQRYVSIMNRLQSLGYNGRVHPALTEQLVNAYGILRERPELAASEGGGGYTVDFLQRVLVDTVHPSMLTDALLLLSCLSQLSHDDGKPMFIW
ncbi:LOW QUALITY PROTEIN: speriolin [Thomomys bottae]